MRASGLLLICSAVYSATGVPLNDDLVHIKVENVGNVAYNVDLDDGFNMEVADDVARNPTSNEYLLYTRQNPTTEQRLVFNDLASINSSNFNPERPTVVIVHGWLLNTMLTMTNNLRNSFLETEDVNLIALDWRFVAIQEYVTAAASTPSVGRALGTFLAYLNRVTGAPFETMHLVGFNLGAHAVGNAGRELEGRIARITGLDPSGPLWTVNPLRLSADDARYVEVIHTDGGVSGLGIGIPSGTVDFFPNGGISQPGCLTSYCDHNRAWQFFDASIKYNHLIGSHCANVAQITLNICRGNRLHLGNTSLFKPATGMFRVNTGRLYPF